jgi:peptidyl-prolyl cis-trans isomerase C
MILASCKAKPLAENTQPQVTAQTPSPTQAPLAVRVNGEGLLLSDYNEELKRYQAGLSELGQAFDPAIAKEAILKMMTDQELLSQAAIKQGYVSDDTALQARYEKLAADAGSEGGLTTWISQNFYSEESFRRALAKDMAAVWMRNKILAEVPATADQVRARQILVTNENEALAIERRLQVGASFETLAYEYEPLTGGDLGWFPAGFLLQPEVEKAAFSLQAGQFSGIIPTNYGFHIVYVMERDAQHQLSPEALLMVQRLALEKWLVDERAKSTIDILVP